MKDKHGKNAGCLEAFFAACLSLELDSAHGSGSTRASSARLSRGKDAVASLGLSRDQIKSLALLPFSSNLGLDEVLPSQGLGKEDRHRNAKV